MKPVKNTILEIVPFKPGEKIYSTLKGTWAIFLGTTPCRKPCSRVKLCLSSGYALIVNEDIGGNKYKCHGHEGEGVYWIKKEEYNGIWKIRDY